MSITLYNEDCIERMKKLPDKSIDLFITDLPYASKKFGKCISCKWDTPIELDDMWTEYKRLRKSKHTPMFFFCNVKHGVDLINSNPKMYRRELCWIKSSATGFLNARRMELKKTEYIYIFYSKLPFYDLSSHKHKFIKHYPCRKGQEEDCIFGKVKQIDRKEYNPQLPTNLIEEKKVKKCRKKNKKYCKYDVDKNTYGGGKQGRIKISKDKKDHQTKYEPQLPTNIIEERVYDKDKIVKGNNTYSNFSYYNAGKTGYEPKLPTNVIDKTIDALYLEHPPSIGTTEEDIYDNITKRSNAKGFRNAQPSNYREAVYEPPLPNNVMRVKSVKKGYHPTEKPVTIIERILKYYSKPGWTVLDMCCGSGSTGKACKNMGRNFIGIELDKKIFDICKKRLDE